MKWLGYGLQGIGGMMALTGMGVFAVGKLVERVAIGHEVDEGDDSAERGQVARTG